MSLLENLNAHCDNGTSQPLVIHILIQMNTFLSKPSCCVTISVFCMSRLTQQFTLQ